MKHLAVSVAAQLLMNTGVAAADPEWKTVAAKTLQLRVPVSWNQVQPKTSMRAAQFSIPGDPADADLVVFHFGGPTGGIQANVERWVGQFQQQGMELNMVQGQCAAGSYILVDCQGTWNKPDGPPFAQKTVATPNSRVVNVIVIEEKAGQQKDFYFIKLSGHQAVVGQHVPALRTAIGVKDGSEKPFALKDAS